ncbi:ribosomal L7Ae/L30e/S12e/Gadd45 family protein [Haloimpatiens lingqiaonensis]|uniref:ribosomal L7Ae/L30e/S12e/Gadd45 family protein n=1 Tax=Haloimpatiens lingqiaonensis TaxID=1380675 RepID=UPI0010FF036B|nr:ribosomal L7Ae/L30e/S12e/Gadd45 family protein [Haloimpatiens lingqiaonensis]
MASRLIGKKSVGIKQTLKAIKQDQCERLYIAEDAEFKLIQPLIDLAKDKSLEIVYIDTMKELGRLCGIDVGAAVACTLREIC